MSLLDFAAIQPARKLRAFKCSDRVTFCYGELVRSVARPDWYRGTDAATDTADQSSAISATQRVLDANLVSHAVWDYGVDLTRQQAWRTAFGSRIALSNVINGYASAGAMNLDNIEFAALDMLGAPSRAVVGGNGSMTSGTTAGRQALLAGNHTARGYTNVGLSFITDRPDLWSVVHHDDPAHMTEAAFYGGDFSAETVASFQSVFAPFGLGFANFKAYALSFTTVTAWNTQYRANRANPATVEGQWYLHMQRLSRDFWVNRLIPQLAGRAMLTSNIFTATPTDELSAWLWPHIDSGLCETPFNQPVQHVFAARMHDAWGNGSASIVTPNRQAMTWGGTGPFANKWFDKRAWATATAYAVGDLVVAHPSSTTTNAAPFGDRTMYEVMTAHTSGNFATDLAATSLRKVRKTPSRHSISAAYAAGGNPSFPWSTYTSGTTTSADGSASFFFCETNDYSDLYGFVARNKVLFDGARNAPVVAIVIPFMQRFGFENCKSVHPNCNSFDLYAYCETLCAAGVPFAIEPVGGTLDPIPLPERLSKYAAIIKGSNADADFGAALPTAANVGRPVFTRTEFTGGLAARYAAATVSGASGTTWVFCRVNLTNRRVFLHVVNFAWTEATDVATTQSGVTLQVQPLALLGLPSNLLWHTPGSDSRAVSARQADGGVNVSLPPFSGWGVLELVFA